jgi:hypothetical protein
VPIVVPATVGARDSEVGDLHPSVKRHQQVLRLEVAMHDPVRLAMGEPGQNPLQNAGDLSRREPADVLAQRPVGQVLHRDVGHRAVLEVLVHGDDVGVVHRPGQARLIDEPLREAGVGEMKGGELLQRNVALKVTLKSEVDDGGAPAPDDLEQVKPTHPLEHLWHGL